MSKKVKKNKEEEEIKNNKTNYDEIIRSHLSCLSLNPMRTGVAYSKLELDGRYLEKKLDSLPSVFSNYKYLKHIDIDFNNISDISSLSQLNYLMVLNCRKNQLTSLKNINKEPQEGEEVEYWKSLAYLDLQHNKISELSMLRPSNLLNVDLSHNEIKKIDGFSGHPRIEYIDLENNQIVDISQLGNLPNLKSINLSFNKIRNLAGFEGCSALKQILLISNSIATFDENLPALEALEELNLSSNRIDKMEEIEKLTQYPLKVLMLGFNPFVEKNQEDCYFQILAKFLNLEKINNEKVTDSLREQTIQWSRANWQEEKRKEEEQRRKEEEEENKDD